MSDSFSEEIKIRVPPHVKRAFDKLAKKKFKKSAELAREAFNDYLSKPEIALLLREASTEYGTSEKALANSPSRGEGPVDSYARQIRRRRKLPPSK